MYVFLMMCETGLVLVHCCSIHLLQTSFCFCCSRCVQDSLCFCQYLAQGLLRTSHANLQDTARSFAGTHDDKQKFKLYMEATHFDETTANLNAAESHVGGMRDILLKQSEHVKVIHSLVCLFQALLHSKAS